MLWSMVTKAGLGNPGRGRDVTTDAQLLALGLPGECRSDSTKEGSRGGLRSHAHTHATPPSRQALSPASLAQTDS